MADPPSDSPSQLTPVIGLLESIDLGATRRRHPPDAAALVAGLSRDTHNSHIGLFAKDQENTLWQLDGGLGAARTTFESRYSDPEDKKLMRMYILGEMQLLHEKIRAAKVDSVVHRLMLLMKSLKVLEKKELDCQSDHTAKKSDLEAKIIHLEEKISNNCDSKSLHDDLDHCISISLEKLHLAKKDLAARLRMVLSVKRQLEDVPSQSELIQYERRFSELNMTIEEIHRQTRKYYATYNALLELKELMLKETSLLNSLNSQFQDAISDTAGRLKLIDSMEGILKGIKQIVLLCRSYRKCKRGSRLIRESAIHSGRSMRQQQLVRDAVLVC
ncbi:hypothetical protein EUGRSUZ_C02843 [Eucalyptus grandis]|uniref:Uncharacterized protein n=1 Tax=Eucalyptus grandis TaxID=71139 RepID=A0ACC3LHF6_EUCGR|nr:hypothetical protein EUGRSUZ_C02843 [Eucalyptus grandis]